MWLSDTCFDWTGNGTVVEYVLRQDSGFPPVHPFRLVLEPDLAIIESAIAICGTGAQAIRRQLLRNAEQPVGHCAIGQALIRACSVWHTCATHPRGCIQERAPVAKQNLL